MWFDLYYAKEQKMTPIIYCNNVLLSSKFFGVISYKFQSLCIFPVWFVLLLAYMVLMLHSEFGQWGLTLLYKYNI